MTQNTTAQVGPLRLRRLAEIAGQLVVDEDIDTAPLLLAIINATLDELCAANPRAFASTIADLVTSELHEDGAA